MQQRPRTIYKDVVLVIVICGLKLVFRMTMFDTGDIIKTIILATVESVVFFVNERLKRI